MKNKQILIGAHVSISGHLYQAIDRAEKLGATTMQIFTKSNRSWFAKNIESYEAEEFKVRLKKSSLTKIVAHSSYLINIASSDKKIEYLSKKSLEEELIRCQLLNIEKLVLHPGAHTGAGEKTGLKKIARNLSCLFESTEQTKLILELTAGQGTTLGSSFDHMNEIFSSCQSNSRLGICLDTCHIFAAGYDISSQEKYENVMEEFNKKLGLEKIKVLHLNNSKKPLGAKKDQHEEIKKGFIPLETFKAIIQDKRLEKIPKILETPNEEKYSEEIELMKSFVS